MRPIEPGVESKSEPDLDSGAPSAGSLVLRDVDFDFSAAQLLIVVGPVRAGLGWSDTTALSHPILHPVRWVRANQRCYCIFWVR